MPAQSHVQQQADSTPTSSPSPRTKRRQQQKARAQKAALRQAHQQQQQQQQQHHPRPSSLQLMSLNVNGLRERQKQHCLQSCKLGHGMSLFCKRHTMLPRQRLHNGVERGQARPYRPMGWPIILGCWHISQPRRGLVVQGVPPSVRGLSLCCRPLWQICCCSRQPEWRPCHHGVSVCSCRKAGACPFLPAKPPSRHVSRHSLTPRG